MGKLFGFLFRFAILSVVSVICYNIHPIIGVLAVLMMYRLF